MIRLDNLGRINEHLHQFFHLTGYCVHSHISRNAEAEGFGIDQNCTRALSLSRRAYDMESLVSPILAAALLSVISFHWLFAGTSIGFICSALLVVSVVLPRSPAKPRSGGIWTKTMRSLRIYLKTPRLKGLLALSLASAAASSMVIVNTVVIVRGGLGFGQREVALTLAAYSSGSMLAAFIIPRLLDKVSDRTLIGDAEHRPCGHGGAYWAVREERRVLADAAGGLVRNRHRLFDECHPIGPSSPPLRQFRRPASSLCSPVCTQS